VYGLAARADRLEGVERIFALKGRPKDKLLQLLVAGEDWLERAGLPSEQAQALARRYWPGPLTIVVRCGPAAPVAFASAPTIGLRFPSHPIAAEIIGRTGPLAATSANRSGEATPKDVPSIRSVFADGVDVYVDAGSIDGSASTVVDTTGAEPVVLREGAIPLEEIRRVLNR
jgi:L-threonylcarbamoyladenylate synthase